MAERDLVREFGIVLPAVAEMMDEQTLSADEAMAALRRFLGNVPQPDRVLESIGRLQSCEDECELREMLGRECVRMLGLPRNR